MDRLDAATIDNLLLQVPEFEPTYREHLAFNQELLPYVLFDEFSRFVIDEYRSTLPDHSKIVERAISYLDNLLTRGGESATLVRTTFVESVESKWSERKLFEGLCALLTPALRAELRPDLW